MQTVVIGGGHAGLAASQQLAQRDVEHVVLERGRVGKSWRSMRWDSFTLNTPSWMNRMPSDGEGDLIEPLDGFITHLRLVDRLESYVRDWELPVREGVEVTRVERLGESGFRVHLEGGEAIDCRTVIAASGIQNVPRLPPIASAMSTSVLQLPALDYKRPSQLPPGAVLVVGGGQTGGQIVEDLLAAGREVYWSISAVTRIPRRYRGRDILEWLVDAGFFEAAPESITDPAELRATMPIISGVGRFGHTLSLQWLASKSAMLVGRITAVNAGVLELDDSVEHCIRFGDQRSHDVCQQIDEGIKAAGVELPPAEPDEADEPFDDFEQLRPPRRLDLGASGVSIIIWATGVTGDFGYLPDGATIDGLPAHSRGASEIPGLEYIGLPWLTRRGSGILYGIEKDAQTVAGRIADRFRA